MHLANPTHPQTGAGFGSSGLAAGPPEAGFEEWYRRQHPRIVATMLLVTGDLALASDCTDEAFARALQHWPRVRAMQSPAGWVFQVARNCSRRNLWRASLERRLLLRTPRPDNIPAPAGELWAVVAGLPPRQREVVVLRHVADLREADIAEVLGISRSTVSTTLRNAYQRLGYLVADTP